MSSLHAPDDKPIRPANAHDTIAPGKGWEGPTYYGRPQLKQAPFENWVVGGYIFLAGLSGAASLISGLASVGRGAGEVTRRGRYLSLLAPSIGSALLVWDLHTPKRFYNMLRIAKATSPMSIGTWILMAFSGSALCSAAAQFAADRRARPGWLRRIAGASHVPAAVAGAGLSTYTAALLSATSTPLWAAAPQALAVRFGASSVVTGAAALSLGERDPATRETLDAIMFTALAVELAAAGAAHETYRRKGVGEALRGGWGTVEALGATAGGNALPLGLLAVSALASRGGRSRLSSLASVAALAGGLLLRVSIMAAGDRSASDPSISMRFAQPENLPVARGRRRRVR